MARRPSIRSPEGDAGRSPRRNTLNDIVNAIDGEFFAQCFSRWVEAPARRCTRRFRPRDVAIHGKTSRRTHDLAEERGPLHMVSARASSQRLVLGQQACGAKPDEITAIPPLLERLALAGALVRIDAMGCQAKVARTILDRGGDYLLAVRDNQPSLRGEIQRYFGDPAAAARDRLETADGDHGRIEVRRHRVSHDVAWLATDRRFPGEPRFPGLKAIAAVEAEVERSGDTSRERRHFLSPMSLDARLSARRALPPARRGPPALGARRGLPRRPQPPAVRCRTAEHGDRAPHGHEPDPRRQG